MDIKQIRFIDRKIGIPICWMLSRLDRFRKKHSLENIKIKKILIIKMWGLGTIVQCSPAILAIRKKYPHAKIVFLTMPSNKGLYDNSGLFDEIIYFPVKSLLQMSFSSLKLIKKIRDEHFDLLIDMEVIARFTAILSVLSGAKITMGFDTKGQGREDLYDIKVSYEERIHISNTMFKFATTLGVQEMPGLVMPKVEEKDRLFVEHLLDKNKVQKNKYIALNINASKLAIERRWPAERFIKVSGFCLNKGYDLIFIGSKTEREYVQSAIDKLKKINKRAARHCFNFAGDVNVYQLTYLFKKARMLITNDSGPLHIAVAASCPTVSFFGPETPHFYGPVDGKNGKRHKVFYSSEHCSPCISIYTAKSVSCRDRVKCMENIKPEAVIKYLDEVL